MSSLRILSRSLLVGGLTAALLAPGAGARAEPTPAELTRQIEQNSTKLERVVESWNRLNEGIKANQAAVAKLTARIGPLEQQVAQGRADVGRYAVTAYKTGGLGTAEVLLQTADRDELLVRLSTLDQLARDRDRQVAGLGATQRQLLDQKTRLEATLARQAAQSRELATGRKKIEADLSRLYELRRRAYGSATEKPAAKPVAAPKTKTPAASGRAGTAVRYAYGALGKPYRWGEDGPGGYDCSGLTSAAWRAAGKSLPHNTAMQWNVVAHIRRAELRPGDLVFYRSLGHVALYVGDGKVIHAPTFGRNVEIRDVDLMPPYGYGRVR
ncbi:NlpC/P60 family protein [Micromonospora sp. WMMD882]|uniref:C40 family peptidase n=1 Tax=Micromonospora sp. WMMD882 TaxID=3015151 RepID=UPI00248AB306|nr:C40 family peptidase [Micromonospora sp. WMMD882]WBB79534.1 NlpC/P60 family protein [Micromonospora sp. WMMD882]